MTQPISGGHAMFRPSSSSSSLGTRYEPSRLERSDALPGVRVGRSLRYGEQAYFWTDSWQQAETLADFDYMIGDDYRPRSLDDLFEWLESED